MQSDFPSGIRTPGSEIVAEADLVQRRDRLALAVLRWGLGLFLLLWSIDKLVAPQMTAGIFETFYHLQLPVRLAPIVGILEGLLSLALIAGAFKTFTYGLALVVHTVSTVSTIPMLLHPFGENHLLIAAIPVWTAFLALFLLRRHDTLWSLSK
jgi:putative oxidoreductase